MLTGVIPVRVTGDGNCLFHAVSRALEEANVECTLPVIKVCEHVLLRSFFVTRVDLAACIGHFKPMSQVCGQGLGIAVDMTHPRLTGDESKINSTSCRIFPIKLGIMSDQNQECPIKVSFPRDNVRSKIFPYIPL